MASHSIILIQSEFYYVCLMHSEAGETPRGSTHLSSSETDRTKPYFSRRSLVEFCQDTSICVTAYTPPGCVPVSSPLIGTGCPVVYQSVSSEVFTNISQFQWVLVYLLGDSFIIKYIISKYGYKAKFLIC